MVVENKVSISLYRVKAGRFDPPPSSLWSSVYIQGMADKSEDAQDRIFVGEKREDGAYPAIRVKEDSLELGSLHPDLQGHGEVVQLTHVEGCEYKVASSIKLNAPGTKGPTQVASKAYRANWDAIFGSKTVGQA